MRSVLAALALAMELMKLAMELRVLAVELRVLAVERMKLAVERMARSLAVGGSRLPMTPGDGELSVAARHGSNRPSRSRR